MKFYSDANMNSDLFKTGYEVGLQTSWLKREIYSSGVSPDIQTRFLYRNTQGVEYRAWTVGSSFLTNFYFGRGTRLTPRVGVDFSYFPSRLDGARRDIESFASLDFSHQLIDHLNLTASVGYTYNISNVTDLYQYQRLTSYLGLLASL